MTRNVTSQTTATPSTPSVASGGGILGSVTPMLLMLVAFYFLLMRPQQKKEAKRRQLVNSAKRDDRVLTSSGIIGKIHKTIGDQEVLLEVAEGVRIRVLKTSILEILEKGSEICKDDTENIDEKKSDQNKKSLVEKKPPQKKVNVSRKK